MYIYIYIYYITEYNPDLLYTAQLENDVLPLIKTRQAFFKERVPEADYMAAFLTDGGGSNVKSLIDINGQLTLLAKNMIESNIFANKLSASMSSSTQPADKATTFATLKTLTKSNAYLSSDVDELEKCCGAIKQDALKKFRELKIPAASKRVFERFFLNCDDIFSKAASTAIRKKAWRVSCSFPR